MRQMKPARDQISVMHVVYALEPGGMEHGVVKLVNGLAPHRVSAICATRPGGALKQLVNQDVPVFELRRRRGNDPSLVWRLYRLFRRERPHIVHTHGWGTLCEGLLAARLARVPVVIHGEHGTLQLKPYQARIQRLAWDRVDQVLAVSSRLAERMAGATEYPLDRIRVIRNGVDLSRFGVIARDEARRALGIADGTVVIGTAGRLVPVKDQATFLDAVAAVAAHGHQVTGIVAGDGPLRGELEARASWLHISDRVRFLGHRPDIERVFAALDLFVLSSTSEGLSNTILEAMASGVPVVATRVGGADELVVDGSTGRLVPPASVAGLAAALEQLIRQPERRAAWADAGRARARQTFGIERMLHEYAALYQAFGKGSLASREMRSVPRAT